MTNWDIETTQAAVNQELKAYLRTQKRHAKTLDLDYYRLWVAIEKLVISGGKRLRPHLCILAYQGYGGKNPKRILKVATSQELLHLSLLVHDDIIDRDFVRYGVPNVAGQYHRHYRARHLSKEYQQHLASGAALMAGDLLLSGAYSLIAESELPPEQVKVAIEQLQQAMFYVGGGELLDTEAVLLPIDKVNTTKIMEMKTAYYSVIAPLLTGAKLAGASSRELSKLTELGRHIGVAYQLTDDLLGVFGNESATGKPTSSDLEEAKRTYLLQTTLQRANRAEKAYLLKTIGKNKVGKQDMNKLRRIITSTGAVEVVQAEIQAHLAEADIILTGLKLNKTVKASLQTLAHKLIDTNRRSVSSY